VVIVIVLVLRLRLSTMVSKSALPHSDITLGYPAANTIVLQDTLKHYLPRLEVHSTCIYHNCPFLACILLIQGIQQSGFYTCPYPRKLNSLAILLVHHFPLLPHTTHFHFVISIYTQIGHLHNFLISSWVFSF